jgi:ATP-binding cassette, subfamily C, bacterial LapB
MDGGVSAPADQLRDNATTDAWLRQPLGRLLRGHGHGTLPLLLLASLLVTLLGLALPLALLQVYDRILPQAALGTLWLMAGAVAVAILLETSLRMARAAMLARLSAVAEAEIHAAGMTRALSTPSEVFSRRGNGWYAERFAAIGTLREMWSGPALQALLDVPFGLLYLLAIWLIAGELVLVPLGLLGAMILVAWWNGRRMRRRAACLADAEERRFNFLFDTLRGLGSLKMLGAEPLAERRYERLLRGSAAARRDLSEATAASQDHGLLLVHLATIGVTAWACLMVLDGTLTVGGLGACTMLAGRSMQPLLGGAALWSRMQSLREARARVAQLAALPPERRAEAAPLVVTRGEVELRDVRFGRLLDGSWLFDGLSLHVRAGEMVGITGANGSGRSSLLRLVNGEVAPDEGAVLVDDQDLRSHDATVAREAIALVAPDPSLFAGTLLDNLTMFEPGLREAAFRLAGPLGMDSVAAGLPAGWETQLGTGGVHLPRDVRQRIGLLRALVRQPRILLLDDVTAQLDAEGDERLAELLGRLRGELTVLIVSHRPSALRLADRVLRIADGRLEPASVPGRP